MIWAQAKQKRPPPCTLLQLLPSTAGSLRSEEVASNSLEGQHTAEELCLPRLFFLQSGQPARNAHCGVSAFSHFTNGCCLMSGKRLLPALATCGLPTKEPKIHQYVCPRERATGLTSGSSVETHWANAKTKPSFKPCWAHKTLSHVITTRRGQFGVLSSAVVNSLRTVHFYDSTCYCAPHPVASCIFAWQNKTQPPVKAAGFYRLLWRPSPTHSHWPRLCLISLA